MELLYLKTFCEVIKWGTYTRTALELDYAQSSVTNHIQKLEESYGNVKLLQRRGNVMVPTDTGEVLYDYAKKILSLHQEAKDKIIKQDTGIITVGTVETLAIYYLPEILEEFKKSYPEVRVRIILDTETNIIHRLKFKEIDFGLILDVPYSSKDINTIPIKKENMIILMDLDHPLSNKSILTIQDIENKKLILTEEGCTYRALLINEMNKHFITCNISLELSSVETIKKAVEHCWGIAFLPHFSVENNIVDRGLKVIPFINPNINFYSQLIYRKDKWISKASQKFIDLQKVHSN
ncbi:LysR family transcriptional regulator [Chengkuizengella marina]|uniref:LysR family transcriptional regulator n=1 Tax=Chengkuizengella marina TaxID=2507566 RepID=A0A6N9Q473_9BACL|nr:LysR family transcriptional regulator [Chengkuizengella marina]NBI29639.1 LysR family transcriptional regulator [Chengkuizengella marina]